LKIKYKIFSYLYEFNGGIFPGKLFKYLQIRIHIEKKGRRRGGGRFKKIHK